MITDPIKLLEIRLGPRLEKAAPSLVLQPTELQDLLIPQLRSMLSIVVNIFQCIETLAKYDKPFLDSKTKKTIKQLLKPEEDLPFIPSALRKGNPIKCSDAYKDNPRMTKVLDDAGKDWEEYAKIKMATHDKTVKKMEITLRYESLQQEFFKFLKTWASGLIIAISFRDGMPEHGILTEDELTAKLSYDSLLDMSDRFPDHFAATAKALNFNDINALNAGFKTTHSYNDATIELKASDSDKEFVMPIAKVLAGLLAPATVALWQQEAEKDVKRGMNAAIRAKLRPQLQAQTALDVSSALSNMGHENQEKQLMDRVLKATREETTKQLQRINKSQRKNSLGRAEIQARTPTESGQSSEKKSKKSKSKQKQQQKKSPSKKQQQPKKRPPKQKRKGGTSTKPRENQDGASGGGEKRGAGRR